MAADLSGKLTLRVITPERVVFEGNCASLQFPGEDGLFGVRPMHAAMITTVDAGVVTLKGEDGKEHRLFVSRGFAQVANDEIRMTVEAGEDEEEIDLERAKQAAERAKERLGKRQEPGFDLVRAEYAMRRALQRLRTKRSGL